MITTSFTDVHGLVLVDAVIEVTQVSLESNVNESWSASNGHHVNNNNHTMYVEAHYWPNAEAKAANSVPLTLRSKDNRSLRKSFEAKPDTADMEALAEAYINDEVLPGLATQTEEENV